MPFGPVFRSPLFRPVLHNGHTLIDGGITEPGPVQLLARAGVSKIIAVNTIPTAEQCANAMPLAAGLPARRLRTAERETGPIIETPTNIINIYMISMYAMQSQIAERACADADVVLRPFLPMAPGMISTTPNVTSAAANKPPKPRCPNSRHSPAGTVK